MPKLKTQKFNKYCKGSNVTEGKTAKTILGLNPYDICTGALTRRALTTTQIYGVSLILLICHLTFG